MKKFMNRWETKSQTFIRLEKVTQVFGLCSPLNAITNRENMELLPTQPEVAFLILEKTLTTHPEKQSESWFPNASSDSGNG